MKQIMFLSKRIGSKYGIDYRELVGVAWEASERSIKKYDPNRGAEYETYRINYIRWELLNYCQREKSRRNMITFQIKTEDGYLDPIEIAPDNRMVKSTFLYDTFRDLSQEAKEVCRIIWETPGELLEMINCPKLARGAVKKQLRQKGWSWPRIENVMRELTQAMEK